MRCPFITNHHALCIRIYLHCITTSSLTNVLQVAVWLMAPKTPPTFTQKSYTQVSVHEAGSNKLIWFSISPPYIHQRSRVHWTVRFRTCPSTKIRDYVNLDLMPCCAIILVCAIWSSATVRIFDANDLQNSLRFSIWVKCQAISSVRGTHHSRFVTTDVLSLTL